MGHERRLDGIVRVTARFPAPMLSAFQAELWTNLRRIYGPTSGRSTGQLDVELLASFLHIPWAGSLSLQRCAIVKCRYDDLVSTCPYIPESLTVPVPW